jgi:ubiquinone/menaquinone biosynthesis C-methylase UbiE
VTDGDLSDPGFARMWTRGRRLMDARGAAEHRRRLLASLVGRVVEVGAGDGANFDRYPTEVEEVVAVEPERHLREAAVAAAGRAPVPVRVKPGTAAALPVPDGWADAVVFSLVLCTVPDQAAALAEARRVLAPGGQLRVYEHVHAEGGPLRLLLAAADRSGIWPRFGGGCHPARDTVAAIGAAGFHVADLSRFRFRPGPLTPGIPFVLGAAHQAEA